MSLVTATASPTSPSATGLAAATPVTRNRAVDAYRAGAMSAVAVGHWLAAAVIRNPAGDLEGANALTFAPQMHWLTWLFQVMPLFFLVGGFANAASLDAAHRAGTPDHQWLAGRLRRLLAPAAAFAAVWGVAGVASQVLGLGVLGAAGAAAVIPLWFLANYTLDTVLAPTVLRLFRRYGFGLVAALGGVVVSFDLLSLAGVPFLPWANWVLGWVFFQSVGFAWRDGRLKPSGRTAATGVAFLAVAAAAVGFGPWSVSMVHAPGLAKVSNTWPPSLPLMLFGIGQCLLAVAAAPAVDRFLARSRRAWTAVVAANGVAMTVYLWHFTAMTIVAALAHTTGLLPTPAIGTGAWWAVKAITIVGAAGILAGLVAVFARHERRSVFASGPVAIAAPAMFALAIVTAASFEIVTTQRPGTPVGALACAVLVGVWMRLRPASQGLRPASQGLRPASQPVAEVAAAG